MKAYWHQHPDTIDRLAAEYALGTMPVRARRRFEAVMHQRQDIQQAVWSWHDTLAATLVAQKPMPVDATQWQRLESRLFAPAAPVPAARRASWWSRWLAPIPSGMLAVGVMVGLALPSLLQMMPGVAVSTHLSAQLPESYVGVLANDQGQAGLVVSSLRRGLKVDIKQQATVAVPAGQVLYLWQIDQAGQLRAVAPLPDLAASHFVSVDLAQPAEVIFKDAHELAVSIEVQGSHPAQPTGPFVYRGLCGKVWQPPKK
ncbi:MAG: anti-sigma factor domain-containing protein [Acidobacteriota bacterium]